MKYFNLFDIQAKAIIKIARELTVTFGQKEIEPELILLAILHTPKSTACEVLSSICGNTASMRLRLESKLMAKLPKGTDETNPGFSRRSVLLLTQSFQEMTRNSSGRISSEHILLAMCFERFGMIATLFTEFDVSRNMIEMWLSAREQAGVHEQDELTNESTTETSEDLEKHNLESQVKNHPLIRLFEIIADKSVVSAVKDYLHQTNCPDMENLRPINIVNALIKCDTDICFSVKKELESMGLKISALNELKTVEPIASLLEEDFEGVKGLPNEEKTESNSSILNRLNLGSPVVSYVILCALSAISQGESLLTPERLVVDYLKKHLVRDEPFRDS